MLKFRIAFLTAVLGMSALVAQTASATTFTFDDEYMLKSGTAFSTIWSGATGSAAANAFYQETQDASHGGIIITRLTTGITNGAIPGEYVQNTSPNDSAGVFLSGWGQSLNYGQVVGNVFNTGLSNDFLRFTTNDTSSIGGLQGTTTGVTFNSFDLKGSGTVTFAGYDQNGNLIAGDTKTVTLTNSFQTFTENWANVATVDFTSSFSGTDQISLDNIVINNTAPVPEPSTLFLLGAGFAGFGLFGRKFRKSVKA
jgi:hypothetical protein